MYENFSTFGAWLNPALGDQARIGYAPELEELGYATIWSGIGADPVGDLALLEEVLRATRTAMVATAITEKHGAAPVAEYRALAQHFPART